MISLFQEISTYDGVNFQDHCERIGALYIFEPIFSSTIYEDNELHVKIAKYVALTHSIESPKLTMSGDRRKEIHVVFKELGIDDEHYNGIVLLKDRDVVKCVQLWMAKQDNRQAEYLFTLQNAYVQQQTASLDNLKKSDGLNTDYDQKMRCIEHMTELKKMIKDAESELQQNDPKMKEAHQEVRKAVQKNVLGIEKFAI
jgi:ribosomal protein S20